MSNQEKLAVTGVTGQLGGMVAGNLDAAGVPFLPVLRSPSRSPEFAARGARAAEYDDREAAVRALEGVETLLMVSASENADRVNQHRTFVDAAAEAGVGHVVYTSFLGAAPDCVFTLGRDHWATEEHIRASGMKFTFLRDSLYLDFLPMMAGVDGVIRGPAGDGKLGAVTRSDVARVATTVLVSPDDHAGETYGLTGPEAVTLGEVAAILTESTGRKITYLDETLDEAYASRAKYEAPDWQVDAWVSTYTSIAEGELELVTGDVEKVTGQAPLSLRDYLDQG